MEGNMHAVKILPGEVPSGTSVDPGSGPSSFAPAAYQVRFRQNWRGGRCIAGSLNLDRSPPRQGRKHIERQTRTGAKKAGVLIMNHPAGGTTEFRWFVT